MPGRAVITGPFSQTGSAVARELGDSGWSLHTLTRRHPPAWAAGITSAPLRLDGDHLQRQPQSADVLIHTYWVRFAHGGQDSASAVDSSRRLVDAVRRAGVGRLVHVSVSNADLGCGLGYYRGKAEVEEVVIPHAGWSASRW